MMDNTIESRERRCPRLGGDIPFSYCRKCGDDGSPCWKIIDCWWELFDVETYLRQQMGAENFQHLIGKKPKPKIRSILDIVEEIRSRED